MISEAQFNPEHTHRYELLRVWDETKPMLHWLMLNPSVANAERLDPTTKRCRKFSESLGYGGMRVVNLFSQIATKPEDLAVDKYHEVINRMYVTDMNTEDLVLAFGSNKYVLKYRDSVVRLLNKLPTRKTFAVGVTEGGYPSHPLYAELTHLQNFSVDEFIQNTLGVVHA